MYKFDPDKAKQLLKDANWDSSRSLQALYVPGTKERDAYMPIIQQQFKDVGITMEIIPSEAAEATRRRNAGEFDLQQIGGGIFRQDPNVSGKYMETINYVPVGGNYGHYTNTRLDELFPLGRATTNQAERKKIYTEAAHDHERRAAVDLSLVAELDLRASKKLVGFKAPSYATHNMWNADEWTVGG